MAYKKSDLLILNWDSVPSGSFSTDLDDEPANNYNYDQIGNLIKDSSQSITSIKWSVYGKPLEIDRTSTAGNTVTKITYAYDVSGHRISKIQENSGTSTKQYTWYAADAQGNTQALYVSSGTSLSGLVINGSKWYMYGSSRLGTYNFQVGLSGGTSSIKNVTSFTGRRGIRYYELNDHLGNELVTVEDRKVEVVSPSNSSLISYYKPFVVGAQQYAPFGMRLPSRIVGAGSYWYGFNGKEKDNELEGEWNLYNYGMREYDPRVGGGFWSVDPLTSQFSGWSPYIYGMDRPVDGVDQDGLEWQPFDKNNKAVDPNNTESITGYRWAGFDIDRNGNQIPKAGTVKNAYVFGAKGVTTLGTQELNYPSYDFSKFQYTIVKDILPKVEWNSYDNISTGDVTTDQKLNTLHPVVRDEMKEFILKSKYRFDIPLRVTGAYRTYAEQDELYAKGRTKPGSKVTNAKGGFSNHNFGLAIDVVPLETNNQGRLFMNWNTTNYPLIGRIGQGLGLEWGGTWKKIVDKPHFQDLQGKTLDQLRALPKDINGLPTFNQQK